MSKYNQTVEGPLCVHCRSQIKPKQPSMRYPKSQKVAHFRCAPATQAQREQMDTLIAKTR
jgi:hypothetical protein